MDIAIPRRMRHLPLDSRGYPVPAGVLIDSSGTPQFAINREDERLRYLREQRCSICGARLTGARWFVGGPLSAFAPGGSYYDPPMHWECSHYALRVCPYLAAPRYDRRLDHRRLPTSDVLVLLDTSQRPERPELFVAILAQRTLLRLPYCRPSGRMRVEFWRHGVELDNAEGNALCACILARPDRATAGA
jgi:hypothetical protein